jgi:hypothetical protein
VSADVGGALRPPRRGLWRETLIVALLGVGAWYTPAFALRFARPALLNFGPNDEDYVRGFREGWERLGVTRFHWTTRLASVRLPLLVRGEGHVLRMRIRRHFVEPAHVRMIAEGRTAGSSFDIKADLHSPYLTLERPLPPLQGGTPFLLMIEAPSDNPAPLGIAMDWMEIRRESRSAVFLPLASMPGRLSFSPVRASGAPGTSSPRSAFSARARPSTWRWHR